MAILAHHKQLSETPSIPDSLHSLSFSELLCQMINEYIDTLSK